jgi:hypothetical protein
MLGGRLHVLMPTYGGRTCVRIVGALVLVRRSEVASAPSVEFVRSTPSSSCPAVMPAAVGWWLRCDDRCRTARWVVL